MTATADNDLLHDLHAADRAGAPLRLRDRMREQTQWAILDAAERTITEEGTAQARIDAIAAAAGVSVGTLYNHFADRDTLVAAVIAHRRQVLFEQVTALVAAEGVGFLDKLAAFFELFDRAGARHGRFFAVVMGEQGVLRSWHCQRDETIAAWLEQSRVLLEQGVREGVLSDQRLEASTTILASLARMTIVGSNGGLSPVAPRDVVHFFLHGVSKHAENVPAGDGSHL